MASVSHFKGEIDIQRLPVDCEEFTFQNWTVKYTTSHILQSICTTTDICQNTAKEPCLLCMYNKILNLPHLPEMVFPKNVLKIQHPSGFSIEFNCLDALKTVCNNPLPLKVACSDSWSETRPPEHTTKKFKPFDWTFSTTYKGTISEEFQIEETNERISLEKLKEKDKILFYHDLMLYEDELHDNGISSCTTKIRVMPKFFFILLRYFLRVDNVMLRINDTRYYHEFGTDHVLREFSNRECPFDQVNLPLTAFGDPSILSEHMPIKSSLYEKLFFQHEEHVNLTVEESPKTE